MFNSIIKFKNLVLIFLLISGSAYSVDWSNLSEESYIDQLVTCQLKIKEVQWSHSIWPKENKANKPLFSEIANKKHVHQQVINNLKMEAILVEVFDFELSGLMLQNEMNRIANNTKDEDRLKKLFAALNHDPTSISQCLALPNILQRTLQQQYGFSDKIHHQLKQLANNELSSYLIDHLFNSTVATFNQIEFVLATDPISTSPKESFNQDMLRIELDQQSYDDQLSEFSDKTKLQELKSSYIYNRIIAKSNQSFTVEELRWKKEDYNIWLKSQFTSKQEKIASSHRDHKYFLPKIISSKQIPLIKTGSVTADTWSPDFTTSGAPNTRLNHSAIWTGTEMIVWGGRGFGDLLTGGRYDPALDSWVSTQTIDAPGARHDPLAIWTGTKMIIWGGTGNASGGVYDPVLDSWTSTSTNGAPTSSRSSAVWTGTQMVVWGGLGPGYVNTGARYNPESNSWSATQTIGAPPARAFHTAVWTGTEMIVWGGRAPDTVYLNSGGRYNPITDSWTTTSIVDAPLGRSYYSVIWSGNQMIIWGGEETFNTTGVNTGGRYNPTTNTWSNTTITGAPDGREVHTATWTGTEMIIWGGGSTINGHSNTGKLYDPVSDSWRATTIVGAVGTRGAHTAIWDGTGMMVWGGFRSGCCALNTGGIYHPYDTYSVGGIVTGLTGNHVILQNNLGSDLQLTADGSFNFSNSLLSGSDYSVTVETQPETPRQNCEVAGGSNNDGTGIIASAAETSIVVTCINVFTIGGTINGLEAGNQVVLQNNEGDDHILDTNGSFEFSKALGTGSSYSVTVLTQPSSPNQTCNIENHNGNITGVDIINITIVCSINTYTIGGTLSGLATDNEVILQSGAGENLTINSNGEFSFITALDDGSAYYVAVLTQPSTPNQTCSISNQSGNISGFNITNVSLVCTTTTYAIAGVVSGLAAGNELVLQNNSVDDLSITTNGLFTFATDLDDASSYNITVMTQPSSPNQNCIIDNANGNITGANITNISVTCTTNTYTIGGITSGLASGNEILLHSETGENLILNGNGSFIFNTALEDGSAYQITILTQPTTPSQTCSIENSSGNLAGINVTNILVICTTNTYTIGGLISQLAVGNEVVLQNNSNDNLIINNNGSYIFTTPLDDLSSYDVSILNQPTTPNQTCAVNNNNGNLAGANIENILILCNTEPTAVNDSYTINEDTALIATDSGVLDNDSDLDNDALNIVTPGTFNTGGIGGSITLESNGHFDYTPPADLFGVATFEFEISDGTHIVSSSLSIDVVSVNDAPDFSISDDVEIFGAFDQSNNEFEIVNFASNLILGPDNESNQQVLEFEAKIISDSDFILNDIDIDNNGTLNIDLTPNYGTALLSIKLQDNGGTENGGHDHSMSQEFFVAHTDLIFTDGFEQLGLMNFLDALTVSNENVIYYESSDSIQFYQHDFYFNNDYSNSQLYLLKLWLDEILILENELSVDFRP